VRLRFQPPAEGKKECIEEMKNRKRKEIQKKLEWEDSGKESLTDIWGAA
jgi:hypothetical protein